MGYAFRIGSFHEFANVNNYREHLWTPIQIPMHQNLLIIMGN